MLLICFLQVDGELLDRALTSKQRNGYTSVLFDASWCPFSHDVRPTFETLSSMFPQMEHYTIEQSSARPRCLLTYLLYNAFIGCDFLNFLLVCLLLAGLDNRFSGRKIISVRFGLIVRF